MDLSLFDHFGGTDSGIGLSTSSSTKRLVSDNSAPVSKKSRSCEDGIEERLAGTVIEKV